MSDFTSGFWSVYISIITVVSIIACGVLLQVMSSRKVSGSEVETTGHSWDEDLVEYNNPLPRWWIWLFYITIVFCCICSCTPAWAIMPAHTSGLRYSNSTKKWRPPMRCQGRSTKNTRKQT